MNKYEEKARQLHKEGNTCSYALYNTFKDDFKLDDNYPLPRSIDGICGSVLVTEKILKDLGKEKYIDEFREKFLKEFKYMKCVELMKNDRRCNDYVGFAANFIFDHINE